MPRDLNNPFNSNSFNNKGNLSPFYNFRYILYYNPNNKDNKGSN